ncbi:hypothetical protein NC652_008231 [Populus alba x Populus x berolinensis]|nr:hypothetical protein NC652_008231 [Populus alba x Populus x berolinensis]
MSLIGIPFWWFCLLMWKTDQKWKMLLQLVPRFAKVPIKMLFGDRVVDGIRQSLTHTKLVIYWCL